MCIIMLHAITVSIRFRHNFKSYNTYFMGLGTILKNCELIYYSDIYVYNIIYYI